MLFFTYALTNRTNLLSSEIQLQPKFWLSDIKLQLSNLNLRNLITYKKKKKKH